jgi:hypothetical protein
MKWDKPFTVKKAYITYTTKKETKVETNKETKKETKIERKRKVKHE